MELFSLMRSTLRVSSVLLLGLCASEAMAQTVVTNEYIYIGVEAEDNINKDDRWVTTTPTTPTLEMDPDGNHSDQAGGSTYLELLPDIRVTHDDPMFPPIAFWGRPGRGPQADYLVNFPEPGRYYIHTRAYSTGTEDNGIHFGINNTWPESSERVQFCSASKRSWWWSSAQRDSGGNGSCGSEKTVWFDIPTAGQHTVHISAREDGFEIDRFALIKDLSNNTRVCSPRTFGVSDVNCRNGSIESADGFVDLRVRLNTLPEGADPDVEGPNPTEVQGGSNVVLTAMIENLDGYDTATDIVLTLSPVPGEWSVVSMDNSCVENGAIIECTLDELHPTAPNDTEDFKFTLLAHASGDLRIDANVAALEPDDTPNNHLAATIVRILGDAPALVVEDTDLTLSMDTDQMSVDVGDTVNVNAVLENTGVASADDVIFTLAIPDGLSINAASLPFECIAGAQLSCNVQDIAGGQSADLAIELNTLESGIYSLSANALSSNDSDSSNNVDNDTVIVNELPVPEVEEPVEEVEEEIAEESVIDSEDSDAEGLDTGLDANTGSENDSSSDSETGELTDGADTEEEIDLSTVVVDTNDEQDTTSDEGDSDSDSSVPTESLQAVDAESEDSGSGAMTHWFVFLLVLVLLARSYGWNQSQLVFVRQKR